jgi:sodium transport system permease protein
MNVHNVSTVYRKELRDQLRDRRTIISMVVVPILMFPLLTVGMGYLVAEMVGKAEQEIPRVMVLGGEDSPKITEALRASPGIQIVPAQADAAAEIVDKKIRAAVKIPPRFDTAIEKDEPSEIAVEYYEGDMKSEIASGTLQKFLGNYREHIAKEQLAARHLPTSLLDPFKVNAENVAPPEKVGGSRIGGLIPYFIIILCLTGAMYPAMDLTAGEKERGTMETILCSPIARTDLVLGKFFMVLTASLATAFLSIISMAMSFLWARKSFAAMAAHGQGNPFTVALDPRGVFAVVVMVLPLSVLFSAALLAIALFAKSYREAQTYVTPLTFIVILPAIASVLPGIELNAKTALIPILSTSLVSKEIVSGNHPWGYIAMIFGISCAYAAIALTFAVKLFNREDVLFRV